MLIAQNIGVGQVIGTINPGPMGGLSFPGVISWLMSLFFFCIGMFSLYQVLLGGFNWVASGGDEKKLTDAKTSITNALIGVLVSVVLFVGWNFVVGPILGIFKNGLIVLPTINSVCQPKGATVSAPSECCSGNASAIAPITCQ